MKTTIRVNQGGTLILQTIGRGQAPLRWLDRLQGKRTLSAVPSPARAPADGGDEPGIES